MSQCMCLYAQLSARVDEATPTHTNPKLDNLNNLAA
jgi:hypothetical protein